MVITIVSIGIAILAVEMLLWRLFWRKIYDMFFPPSMDTSSIHFFSLQWIRGIVIVHALMLMVSTLFPLWLLW